jgi:hypothetical protein
MDEVRTCYASSDAYCHAGDRRSTSRGSCTPSSSGGESPSATGARICLGRWITTRGKVTTMSGSQGIGLERPIRLRYGFQVDGRMCHRDGATSSSLVIGDDPRSVSVPF